MNLDKPTTNAETPTICPDFALFIINVLARWSREGRASRWAAMLPPLNDDEMADLILAAAMAVCERIGDHAAIRTIAEVRQRRGSAAARPSTS